MEGGHLEVVKLLLKDPRVDLALEIIRQRDFVKGTRLKVVKLLLSVQRVDPVLATEPFNLSEAGELWIFVLLTDPGIAFVYSLKLIINQLDQ
jgi:hypothetical protein